MFLLAAGVVVDFVLRAREALGVVRLQYRWRSLAGLLTVLGGVAAIVGDTAGVDLGYFCVLGAVTVPLAIGVVMGVGSETMQPVSVGVWVWEG